MIGLFERESSFLKKDSERSTRTERQNGTVSKKNQRRRRYRVKRKRESEEREKRERDILRFCDKKRVHICHIGLDRIGGCGDWILFERDRENLLLNR